MTLRKRSVWFDEARGCEVKRCSRCQAEKPVTEFYTRPGGYHPHCKLCDRAEKKAHYAADPETARAQSREWARKHPDEHRARYERWAQANQERRLDYYRRYNDEHREERRAYDRIRHAKETPELRALRHQQRRAYFQRWNIENRERLRQKRRVARRANPQPHRDAQSRRRARIRSAPIYEPINRLRIIERDKSICYLCGKLCVQGVDLTLDHVIPITRGGTHTYDNLRVACVTCNARKWTYILDPPLS